MLTKKPTNAMENPTTFHSKTTFLTRISIGCALAATFQRFNWLASKQKLTQQTGNDNPVGEWFFKSELEKT